MDANLYFILGAVAIILLIYLVTIYNRVISVKNNVRESYATIDTVLKNRADLIPNLISMIKSYMKFEAETLERVIAQRSGAYTSGTPTTSQGFDAEASISTTCRSIFALAESYPDLKSSSNFLQVQGQLTELENRLQAARRTYNSSVKELDDIKEQFPTNIIAGMTTIPHYDMFQATEAEKQNVDVGKLLA